MSFRRLVHLVVDDVCTRRRTYSLRSIDMSHLFRPPLKLTGGHPACSDHPPPPVMEKNQEMAPSPLPDPAMRFNPPGWNPCMGGKMGFMLLGGRHNKVVATDQAGRAVLYDPDQHTVRTLHGFVGPKSAPVSLTVGGDDLYVFDTRPTLGNEDRCFECLEIDEDEDWYPRVLPPPPPYRYDETATPSIDSYAMSGDGSRIWISGSRVGSTYSFDTSTEAWSEAGSWELPFSGLAEYVPEHGLWFGLRRMDDRCEFCAVDLTSGSAKREPAVRSLGNDLTPPAGWMPRRSHLVHLGSSRFCVARFFNTEFISNPFASGSRGYPVIRAVFTAVEVQRCIDADGGLRMVKHGSKLYTLLEGMSYRVL